MSKINFSELRKIQEEMKNKVLLKDGFKKLELFCGCDVSYQDATAYVAFVTLNNDFEIVEKLVYQSKVQVPYVPTFLSFREGPLIIEHFHKLQKKPDVLLIDGHGIAHPKRMGLATHVGVELEFPTIGIAKKNLCAEIKVLPEDIGEHSPMYIDGKKVGYVIKSSKRSKCIFVSPGNLVSVESSFLIVEKMLKNYKLPEPSRLAHNLSQEAKSNKHSSQKC